MIRQGFLLGLAACGASTVAARDSGPLHGAAANTAACTSLCVDWSMAVEGHLLRIDFVVENAGSTSVRVAATLPNGEPDPDAIVVRADADEATVAFTRAWVPPARGVLQYHPDSPPTFVEVSPGTIYRGTVHALLPLTPWRFNSIVYPIAGHRTGAVFEIAYDDHPGTELEPRSLPMLRGKRQPFPPGVVLPSPDRQAAADPNVQNGTEPPP